MKPSAFALLILFSLFSCAKNTEQNEKLEIETLPVSSELDQELKNQNLTLLKTICFACHDPKATSHDNMLAPPLAGIKNRYKNAYPEKEAFIERMANFITLPSEEKALMKGPVRRFGLMPKPPIADSIQIRDLVAFIYDNPIEAPDWFAEHLEEMHGEDGEEQLDSLSK